MDLDETAERLVAWAAGRDDVQAVILTSTRAIPGATLDAYSDYDIILVVEDVLAMEADRGWLSDFGEVLISYWDPVEVREETGAIGVGNITNYVDGLKIDFSLWSRQRYADVTWGAEPDPELDAGHHTCPPTPGPSSSRPSPGRTRSRTGGRCSPWSPCSVGSPRRSVEPWDIATPRISSRRWPSTPAGCGRARSTPTKNRRADPAGTSTLSHGCEAVMGRSPRSRWKNGTFRRAH